MHVFAECKTYTYIYLIKYSALFFIWYNYDNFSILKRGKAKDMYLNKYMSSHHAWNMYICCQRREQRKFGQYIDQILVLRKNSC